jgi:hypothetical protein
VRPNLHPTWLCCLLLLAEKAPNLDSRSRHCPKAPDMSPAPSSWVCPAAASEFLACASMVAPPICTFRYLS